MVISHWLNATLVVWEENHEPDGAGGYTVTFDNVGSVAAKVDQSTAQERMLAQQPGAEHTHNIYLEPTAGVTRNHLLADSGVDPNTADGGWYRVLSTHTPSSTRYLKAVSQRVEGSSLVLGSS